MNIYTEIENEIKSSRKAGLTKVVNTLSLVLGEIQRHPNIKVVDGIKIYDNEISISVLKSLQKNWIATLEMLPEEDIRRSDLLADLQIIQPYFPRQLTEDQLKEIKFNTNPQHLGHWMKFLKENYPGQYDGAIAKKIFEC